MTVRVDFSKGAVSWSVQGAMRATAENALLKDTAIKWVPFLLVYNKSVFWIVAVDE